MTTTPAPTHIPPAPVDLGEVLKALDFYGEAEWKSGSNPSSLHTSYVRTQREKLIGLIARFAGGKDGERYRFMRAHGVQMAIDSFSIFTHDSDGGHQVNRPEQIDAAIDAALSTNREAA